MVDVCKRKCRTEGCGKRPPFGVAGTKTVEYCGLHASVGMVNVNSRKCRTESCDNKPSFGVTGTKTVEYRAQHAQGGMVDVKRRYMRTRGCSNKPYSLKWPTQERWSTVHSTPDYNAMPKETGIERLAHTTPGRK